MKEGRSKSIDFLTDALGSNRDVVDSTGAVKASYEFSEYGGRIATFEDGVATTKTYVGGLSVQDEVSESGLMLMGHRFYQPSGPSGGIGRFLNRDPIGFSGGMNLYEYSYSQPVSMTDHTGLGELGTLIAGTTSDMYNYGNPTWRQVSEFASIGFEPLDWYLTAEDIYLNGPSWYHALGLAPFVPGIVAKYLRKTPNSGSGRVVRSTTNPASPCPEPHEVKYQHLLGEELQIKAAARNNGVNLDNYILLHWLNPSPGAYGGMIEMSGKQVGELARQPIILLTDRALVDLPTSIITGAHEKNHILTKQLFGWTNETVATAAEWLPRLRLGR